MPLNRHNLPNLKPNSCEFVFCGFDLYRRGFLAVSSATAIPTFTTRILSEDGGAQALAIRSLLKAPRELSPNLGDVWAGQAAAVLG